MVVMGRVVAPYGVAGWIKIQTFTETVDSLISYSTWWLAKDSAWIERKVLEVKVHGNVLVARLQDCTDRDQAFSFRGHEIAVPRSELPKNQEGEFYWIDLVGLKVIDGQNRELGVVEGVLETGANDVLEVKGEKEILIPYVNDVIIDVNLKKRHIVVNWDSDY